jgi:hypothetical protein
LESGGKHGVKRRGKNEKIDKLQQFAEGFGARYQAAGGAGQRRSGK